MKMNLYARVLIVCAASPIALFSQQYSPEQVVADNIAFFEHMFSTIGMTSGVHQQSYLEHLKLSSKADRDVVLKVASEFLQNERTLHEQASMALSEKRPEMSDKLSNLRSQRNQLLQQSAVRMLRNLDSSAFKRLVDYMQAVAATVPKRVKQ